MNVIKKKLSTYLPLIPMLLFLHINSAMAISKTDYCPYSSTSQCTAWLSETDPAFNVANIRYWPYVGFVNPFGELNIELKSLPSANQIHLFKDGRTQQNTFDTSFINTYTKVTRKMYYDTRRSIMEFLVHDGDHVYHVTLKTESDIPKAPWWDKDLDTTWTSSENCITIDGIEDCYKLKNKGWYW